MEQSIAPQQQAPVLTFENKEYLVSNLDDNGKSAFVQLNSIQQKINATNMELEMLQMARSGYISILRTSTTAHDAKLATDVVDATEAKDATEADETVEKTDAEA